MATAMAATVGAGFDAPASYPDAMASADKVLWLQACKLEFDALRANDTWSLVPREPGMKIIPSKWVFKVKCDANGNPLRHKARFVARGFVLTPGVDYTQSFAPVVQDTSLRVCVAAAAQRHRVLRQVDIKNAFTHAPIEGDVYVQQPEGFVTHGADGAPLVLKLRRSLYGLAVSPRLFHNALADHLHQTGYVKCPTDPCVFHRVTDDTLLLCYVDDIVVSAPTAAAAAAAIDGVATRFELTDLGDLSYFLGQTITRTAAGVTIDQTGYVESMLARFGLGAAHGADTPAVTPGDYDASPLLGDADAATYRSMVGALLYVSTHTRPDIAYAVCHLARFMSAPRALQLTAAKRVFRYLRAHPGGITYAAARGAAPLTGFADASFAADAATGRSVTGYTFVFGGAAVCWRSRLQALVTLSTTEAEYVALSDAAREVLPLLALLQFMGVRAPTPVLIHEDNTSALQLTVNPVVQQRTRHIGVKYHFIRELVARRVVDVVCIDTAAQPADLLTKSLPKHAHAKHAAFVLGGGV